MKKLFFVFLLLATTVGISQVHAFNRVAHRGAYAQSMPVNASAQSTLASGQHVDGELYLPLRKKKRMNRWAKAALITGGVLIGLTLIVGVIVVCTLQAMVAGCVAALAPLGEIVIKR